MVKGKPLSVSQLNTYIKGVFEDELVLHNLCVYGEIYDYSVSGGNTYVTLRDGDCSLACVRYGVTERYPIGSKVLLNGSVTFYPRGGRVSFVFRTVEPYGQSVQYAAFLRLKEELRARGWFANRPPLPSFIGDVVVVTSATGAVIHDFIRVVSEKQPFVRIRIYPVKVQGDDAAKEIAAAIDEVNAKVRTDVIVVARGGGANVDLEPFNTETVAAAVHRSGIPVLSAVGHEVDTTLCDYCASVRAATPSVAGEIVVSTNARLMNRLVDAAERATRAVSERFTAWSRRLYRAAIGGVHAADRNAAVCRQRLETCRVRAYAAVIGRLHCKQTRVQDVVGAIGASATERVSEAERQLGTLSVRLHAVDPMKLLAAGFARVAKDGVDVTRAEELNAGDRVVVRFADGAVKAEIGERYGI